MTPIARRECCCRAYKCDRIPTYGLPPLEDVDDGPVDDGTGNNGKGSGDFLHRARDDKLDPDRQDLEVGRAVASSSSCGRGECGGGGVGGAPRRSGSVAGASSHPPPAAEAPAAFAGGHHGDDSTEATASSTSGEGGEGAGRKEPGDGASQQRKGPTAGNPDAAVGDLVGERNGGGGGDITTTARLRDDFGDSVEHEQQGGSFEGGQGGAEGGKAMRRPRRNTVELLNAGKAIACREHALEGMVYLGQK